MRIRRPAIATAVTLPLLACGLFRGNEPTSQPLTTTTGPAPAPAKTTAKADTSTGTLSVRGTAQSKTRVNCADIQTEARLTAEGGPVDWTSKVVAASGGPAGAVSVSPASGRLATGAGVVAKVRGRFPADQQRFTLVFAFPTSTGGGSVSVDVGC